MKWVWRVKGMVYKGKSFIWKGLLEGRKGCVCVGEYEKVMGEYLLVGV